MRLLCSFSHLKFRSLQAQWVRYRVGLKGYAGLGSRRRERLSEPGLLALVDLDSGRILRRSRHPRAAGFLVERGRILLCAGHEIRILHPSTLRTRDRISHPPFNSLRWIEASGGGYLVADAGTDTVFRLDSRLEIVSAWNATEHGFDLTPLGRRRRVRLDRDHRRRIYPTIDQATHLNCAVPLPRGGMLVCLFHQGAVVEVAPDGSPRRRWAGLKGPHAIRPRNETGFYLSDSWHNRIVFHDHGHRRVWELGDVTDWLQDALDVGRDAWVIADSGNHRIIRLDRKTGRVEQEYRFNSDWRIYQIEALGA
ncbi:MAG: hypothetical protein HYY13_07890 [Nitrospirae bacterium]|nr:hypothetical protein [Nitrospirota bacterium]